MGWGFQFFWSTWFNDKNGFNGIVNNIENEGKWNYDETCAWFQKSFEQLFMAGNLMKDEDIVLTLMQTMPPFY